MATSAQRLHAVIGGLRPGQSVWVDAASIGASAAGFHAIVQTWVKFGGGHGFELVGDPHKQADTGLYDKARLRRLPPNTKPAPLGD
jgi:hypothetical protein